MIRITFLGTAAARPTVGRGVSAFAVQREASLMLFDCGEGTQRQMMRYGTGFAVADIFFTHVHADHLLGLTGLLRTMALQGRTDPIGLYGPPRSRGVLEDAVRLGVERVAFPVHVTELAAGEVVERAGFGLRAVAADHGTPAFGWVLEEEPRLGRFDVERARELGVPPGPLFGRLHRGEAVDVGGRTVTPDEVVGPTRPGRKVVFSGDSRPCRAIAEAARAADLLVHEATFADAEAERARETGHSTAREAAEVARAAGVRRLILTHISARYADAPGTLEAEAARVFRPVTVAHDGLVVEVPFPEEDMPVASGAGDARSGQGSDL